MICIQGRIHDYDTDGKGETWDDALTAYAADCRRAASNYQQLVEALLDEAHRADKMRAAISELAEGEET